MQSGWPNLSELECKLIDRHIWLANVASHIDLVRKDVFAKLKSVYLYFCPQSLKNFTAIDQGIDPEYLSIEIIPDGSRTIVQELSSHKFENLERFSLEYLGHDGFVNVKAIASLLNFNQVKLISLSVAYINVLELLWSLDGCNYDSFTLTTLAFTLGGHKLKTSEKIIAELRSKFKKFNIYTIE